jgi:hypothetical protein
MERGNSLSCSTSLPRTAVYTIDKLPALDFSRLETPESWSPIGANLPRLLKRDARRACHLAPAFLDPYDAAQHHRTIRRYLP